LQINEDKQQPRSSTYSSKRNAKKRLIDPVDEELLSILKQPDQDEHYHYGLCVGNQLRKMQPAKAAKARLKIEKVLFKAQFGSTENVTYEEPE
jgi:hypothetical protein